MIRIINMADEHKLIPNGLLDKSEMRKSNEKPDYQRWDHDVEKYKVYCTYAWIETDEIETEDFPIAVMDYKPKYSKRTIYVFAEPIWQFMQDERTPEQQKFIERNLNKINELFIDFAQSQGFLTDFKK